MKNLTLIALGVISASSVYAFSLQTNAFNQSMGPATYVNIAHAHASQLVLGEETSRTGAPAPCPMPPVKPVTPTTSTSTAVTASAVATSAPAAGTAPATTVGHDSKPCMVPPCALKPANTVSSSTDAVIPAASAASPSDQSQANPTTPKVCPVVPTNTTTVTPVTTVAPIASSPTTFPDGTLVKGSGHTIYIVFGNKKYGIPSQAAFKRLHLSFQDVQQVSDATLQDLPTIGIDQ